MQLLISAPANCIAFVVIASDCLPHNLPARVHYADVHVSSLYARASRCCCPFLSLSLFSQITRPGISPSPCQSAFFTHRDSSLVIPLTRMVLHFRLSHVALCLLLVCTLTLTLTLSNAQSTKKSFVPLEERVQQLTDLSLRKPMMRLSPEKFRNLIGWKGVGQPPRNYSFGEFQKE